MAAVNKLVGFLGSSIALNKFVPDECDIVLQTLLHEFVGMCIGGPNMNKTLAQIPFFVIRCPRPFQTLSIFYPPHHIPIEYWVGRQKHQFPKEMWTLLTHPLSS